MRGLPLVLLAGFVLYMLAVSITGYLDFGGYRSLLPDPRTPLDAPRNEPEVAAFPTRRRAISGLSGTASIRGLVAAPSRSPWARSRREPWA
jgi:hypothetical protein